MPSVLPKNLVAVCIPSKSRAELFYKKTYAVLKHLSLPWRVFVEPQDYDSYQNYIPARNIIRLNDDNLGLAYSLNCIGAWCIAHGFEFCWKLDDDTHHFFSPQHLTVAPKETQAWMLVDTLHRVLMPARKELGDLLGAITFPGKLFYKDYRRYTHANKKLEGLYIIRPHIWYVPVQSKGFEEESYASAYLQQKGLVYLRTGMLACEHDLSKYPGGLQCYDRAKGHLETFNTMMRVNPQLTSMLPTRISTYANGASFQTVNTRGYNKKYAARLPLKPNCDKFAPEVAAKLNKLAAL